MKPGVLVVLHPTPEGRHSSAASSSPVPDWSALGVDVRFVSRDAVPAGESGPGPGGSAVLTRQPDGDLRIDVVAPDATTAAEKLGPLLVATVAHCAGMVHVTGTVAGDGAVLVLGRGAGPGAPNRESEVLVPLSAEDLAVHVVDRTLAADRAEVALLERIAVESAGEGGAYVSPKAVAAHLRVAAAAHIDAVARATRDARLFVDLDSAMQSRIVELSLRVPARTVAHGLLSTPSPHDVRPAGATPGGWEPSYSPAHIVAVRQIQEIAAGVYGTLEGERAIAWALEELGELAQAMRRRERPARLSEELGQLFAWVVCLANICEIDLADAAAGALEHEVRRQLVTHGRLRPYVPAGAAGVQT